MTQPDLTAWTGRQEMRGDIATPALAGMLAATFDHDGAHLSPRADARRNRPKDSK